MTAAEGPEPSAASAPLLAPALRYAAMGMHVFPVTVRWDAELGKKHATFTGSWKAISTTDPGQIEAWFGPGGLYRDGTVAIDCGKSGIVVVDADGERGLTEWARLRAEFSIPPTYVVRTPGGGEHWYYRAGFIPAGIDAHGKLAPKVDVRGVGGLVFAPPSSDARGAYSWVEGEPDSVGALTRCPDVVGQRVPPRARDADPFDGDGLTESSRHDDGNQPASADPFAPPARAYTREQARAIVGRELAAFRAMRTPQDSGFNDALNRLAVVYGHFVPAFVSQAQAVRMMYAAAEHNRSVEYQGAAGVMATIRSGLAAGMREPYEVDAGGVLGDGDDAPGNGEAGSAAGEVALTPVEALLARMLDREALDSIPAARPLIEGVLDLDSESWMIGAPGGFKSFVALDMSCHVATGRAWRGHKVTAGRVVYMAAEGKKGIPLRIRAWESVYEQRADGVTFLPEPVQVADTRAWAVLIEACRQLEPVLVVLDTQARITVGIDENSAGAMSILTDAVRRLKEATGACVLVVHHTGRNGEDARGSSAIDGAQDTELRVDRPKTIAGRRDLVATISTDKQKDGDESELWEITMRKVDLGTDPVTGRALSSLAIEPADPFAPPVVRVPEWISNLTENQGEVLAAFREHSDGHGATRAQAMRWVAERRKARETPAPAMPPTSFDSAVRVLVDKDLIVRIKGGRLGLAEYLTED